MDRVKDLLRENRKIYNGLLLVIFTAILFFIAFHKLETNKLDLKIGDLAPTDIRATKDLVDDYTRESLRKDAANNVEPKYRISPSIQMSMKNKIKNLLDTTRDIKAEDNLSIKNKAEKLDDIQNIGLSSEETYILIRMDYKSLNSLENNLMDLINQVMGNGIKDSELEYEKENLAGIFETLDISEEEKLIGHTLLKETIAPNNFVDKIETQRLREKAEEEVGEVIIKENGIIVNQGSIITEREADLMKESGLLKEDNKFPIKMIVGIIILILLVMIIFLGYIYYFSKDMLFNNRLLVSIIVILLTIIISENIYLLSPYIMPIGMASLLISILINPKLGLLINMFISFFLGFILKLDTSVITMYIISGSIGALISMKQDQRYNIMINGAIIGIVNLLALGSINLARGLEGIGSITTGVYLFLNGIIAAIITLGSLPLWENVFSILTPLKLLELSNPNQPLLKKFLLEAPGTYHHSILVGNLAESAAETISANPLIARVGAYYHDVGKTERPYYFKENQFGIENPHDKLQPMQSVKIITSHTIDGIKLGKEYKLPKEIIDIIEQHHGDTLVAYFYHKYKEENPDINISADEFRYKGKKPQTKEAAIIMLADSTEAAVRSIKELNNDKINKMVTKVVQGKLNDGQLDECNITLKEIQLIIDAFTNVLTGIHHDRIEYPVTETDVEVSK
ncbi:MAG TPA: HDIG domain-containing protein [Tissierellaceae bacterium]|nr:HDIG domain-containing protein [Tissierellaceae bacterium]